MTFSLILKKYFFEEPFGVNQSAYSITVYTNLDYAADQVYAHVKRYKGKHDWTYCEIANQLKEKVNKDLNIFNKEIVGMDEG